MTDEEILTAGAIRAMGHWVPWEIADHVRMRMTRRLDAESEVVHVQIEAFPEGYIERVDTVVKVQ